MEARGIINPDGSKATKTNDYFKLKRIGGITPALSSDTKTGKGEGVRKIKPNSNIEGEYKVIMGKNYCRGLAGSSKRSKKFGRYRF